MGAVPAYRNEFSFQCAGCSEQFATWNRSAKYCSERCRTDAATARRDRSAAGAWLQCPAACGVCGAEFWRTKATGPNKKYCSPECAIRARRRDNLRFKELYPGAMEAYNRTRARNHGPDSMTSRLRRRHPDLPTICEAVDCDEGRVLELAHKPEHRRNGAWRTMDRYERHMFWVLCPTCHRVLDYGIETPEQLGLT